MRILVVDDCEDTVETLCILLRLWGHEVRAAHDGSEALAMAGAYKPDVILLDILLPRQNGYQVARQLRQLPEISGALLVAVTGYAQSEDFAKSREAGFDRQLVKPVQLDELQRLLEARLGALT
jgi:two-component system, chemotaxis family, CheB/CheR fusion protein